MNRLPSLMFGLFFGLCAWFTIHFEKFKIGPKGAGRGQIITPENSPILFWFIVSVMILISGVLLYRFFSKWKP
jgi:hypothetical protein